VRVQAAAAAFELASRASASVASQRAHTGGCSNAVWYSELVHLAKLVDLCRTAMHRDATP
jgi:hypothetical protein